MPWSFHLMFTVIYREALHHKLCSFKELLRAVDFFSPSGLTSLRIWQLVIHSTKLHWQGSILWWWRKMAAFLRGQSSTEGKLKQLSSVVWRCIIVMNNLLKDSQGRKKQRFTEQGTLQISPSEGKWAHRLLMVASPTILRHYFYTSPDTLQIMLRVLSSAKGTISIMSVEV